jgi:UDP-glucose 4-epimerase
MDDWGMVVSNKNSEYSGKTVLITGGAGFVGSHLAEKLVGQQADVIVLDNLSTGRRDNINNNKVELFQGDIRDSDLVDSLVKRSDIIFHLAEYIPETANFGTGHVIKYSVENPLLDFDVSCYGSLIVLDKCRKYDKQILFTSSAAVYGEPKETLLTEDSRTIPSSPYGASKLCAETYMRLYSKLYGLNVTIARFCNLYGPRQRKYLLHDILLKLMKDPQHLEILGTGRETRDFIYVEDAINAVMLVSRRSRSNDVVFNVGTGVSTSINEIATLTLTILSLEAGIIFTQSSWKGDIRTIGADVDKIKALGFKPIVPLKDGIAKTIEWFNKIYKPSWYLDD